MSVIGVDDSKKEYDNRAELVGKDEFSDSKIDSNKVGKNDVAEEKNYWKTSKFKKLSKSIKTIESLGFLILRTRLVFTKSKQVFFKAPIFYYFNPKHHIQMKMDALGYQIDGVLNELTLNDSSRWHPMAFFF